MDLGLACGLPARSMELQTPEVMISEETLRTRVAEMGAEISADFSGEDLTIVSVLKGSFMFTADLVRSLLAPRVRCEFLALSSYGSETESSGVVAITQDLTVPVHDRNLLIVEDIVDTGLTMSYLVENLKTRGPKSVKIASLLSKPARRQVQVNVDYLGFTIEDEFVVGYGLDYDSYYRNLPYIGVLQGA